jgi:rRNA processing protein Gar1
MSGRVRQKVYQYDGKGTFIQEFESEAVASRRYYGDKRPLFQTKDYHLTDPTSILLKKRIGRDNVKKLFRKINSPYITIRADEKLVECLNLNNEVIATYKGAHIASLLSGVSRTTIEHQLKTCKNTNKDLFFRYAK